MLSTEPSDKVGIHGLGEPIVPFRIWHVRSFVNGQYFDADRQNERAKTVDEEARGLPADSFAKHDRDSACAR